jgi:hypothetical protein
MANNYYQTTVQPEDLILTPALAMALKAHDASIERQSEDTALDQIVRGDRNQHDVYVFFENGWSDGDEAQFAEDLKLSGLSEEERVEAERLARLPEEDLYREILLVNPKVVAIEVNSAHYCSKMRPGEFGGHGLYVTRTHYLHIGDHSARIEADGSIKIAAKVQKFSVKKPKKEKVTK